MQLDQQNRFDAIQKFVNDEDGLEAVQVVMITAIAALVLIVFMTFWDQIKGWASGLIQQIVGKSAT